jgi:MFS family permease
MTTTGAKPENLQGSSGSESLGETAIGQEKSESPASAFGEAPDGGLQAWLVAAGAGSVLFSALGFANSFGVFQEYYMTHQLREKSADDVAWIGSLSMCVQMVTGAIAGPLFDRYGVWVCSLPILLSLMGMIVAWLTQRRSFGHRQFSLYSL